MNLQRACRFLCENLIFYLVGILVVLGFKYYYSQAECDSLLWILAPTTRWVELLSGIPFTYVSGTGYVNHSLRLLIAPSCSGVQFMIITIATLVFSFVHIIASPEDAVPLENAALPEDAASPKNTAFPKGVLLPKDSVPLKDVSAPHNPSAARSVLGVGRGTGWIAACVVFSWLFTVLVNGLRIIVSIYLPLYLERAGLMGGVLTPDRLHTMIGVVVYFSALLTLYRLVDFLLQRKTGQAGRSRCIVPLFWYFLMTLGLPLLNRAYVKGAARFKEFAVLVTCCIVLVLLPYCMLGLWRSAKRGWGKR